jgi:hypothetical protein
MTTLLWFLHSSTEFTAEGSICSRSLPGSDACAMAVHSSVCTVICLLTDVILEAPPYSAPNPVNPVQKVLHCLCNDFCQRLVLPSLRFHFRVPTLLKDILQLANSVVGKKGSTAQTRAINNI